MASSPGPSTPDEAPRPRMTTANRSFTVPAKASTPTKSANASAEIGSTGGIETLYHHPSVKLVKFTASARPGASIPWQSPTESTIAVGPFEIYRVPGSVSFLKSGPIIHTIMARSNCWCVDGASKFVLRILMDKYYRIELPGETEEDLEHVEKFKVTLQKVCYYEKTPCPFTRTFSVDIPDAPEPEVLKKGKRRKSTGPAKKWKLDRVWRPEGWVEPEKVSEESASGSGSPDGSDEESDVVTPMEEEEANDEVRAITPITPMRQRALAALRSASAPQSPAPLSTPPSRLRTRLDVDGTVEVTEPIASGSSDREEPRLRTFQAIPTDMPPSPPDSSAGLEYIDDRARVESNTVNDPSSTSSTAGSDDTVKPAPEKIVTVDEQIQNHEDMSGNEAPNSDLAFEDHTTLGEEARQNDHGTTTGASRTELGDEEAYRSIDEVAAEPSTESIMRRAMDLDSDYTPPQKSAQDVTENFPETENTSASLLEEREISRPQTPQILQDYAKDEEPATLPEEALPVPALPAETLLGAELRQEQFLQGDDDYRPVTPENQTMGEDPYAAIQARIMARRSLSGTVSFHPSYKSPTRQSTSSNSSTATISSSRSSLSRRQNSQQQQAFTSAMVKKAYNAFLGPPAHLVAIMLKIAARFANGAFGVESMFYVESPANTPRKVPGTYYLNGDDVEELDSDFEEEEDDFGVPLNSPVRLASRSDSGDSVRERRKWDVD